MHLDESRSSIEPTSSATEDKTKKPDTQQTAQPAAVPTIKIRKKSDSSLKEEDTKKEKNKKVELKKQESQKKIEVEKPKDSEMRPIKPEPKTVERAGSVKKMDLCKEVKKTEKETGKKSELKKNDSVKRLELKKQESVELLKVRCFCLTP